MLWGPPLSGNLLDHVDLVRLVERVHVNHIDSTLPLHSSRTWQRPSGDPVIPCAASMPVTSAMTLFVAGSMMLM